METKAPQVLEQLVPWLGNGQAMSKKQKRIRSHYDQLPMIALLQDQQTESRVVRCFNHFIWHGLLPGNKKTHWIINLVAKWISERYVISADQLAAAGLRAKQLKPQPRSNKSTDEVFAKVCQDYTKRAQKLVHSRGNVTMDVLFEGEVL